MIWICGMHQHDARCVSILTDELIGELLNKCALTVHAEANDWLLEVKNKIIRTILQESVKSGSSEISYSMWITNLTEEEIPGHVYGLYL